MELDILPALLPHAVSVYDLSARFPIEEITRLRRLGFICRVGDEYRITASGKHRIVVLSDQAKYFKDDTKRCACQKSNKKRHDVFLSVKASIFAIFGWFFAHISPAELFHKISEWLRSLFH